MKFTIDTSSRQLIHESDGRLRALLEGLPCLLRHPRSAAECLEMLRPGERAVLVVKLGAALELELNLVASAWFTILASSLSWIMPGINALISRRTRPDLVATAPWSRWLPVLGAIWLAFTLVLYWFAGVGPILNALTNPKTDPLTYLNGSGVTFVGIVLLVGIVWYVIQAWRNRQAGIETGLMYQMLPPD